MTTLLITSMGGSGSLNLLDTLRLSPDANDYTVIGTHFDPVELAKSDLEHLYVVPKAATGEPYVAAHQKIIDKHGVDLLIANSDMEVAAFSPHLDRLSCRHLIPDAELVRNVQDKFTLNQILKKHGNPVIPNIPVKSREHLREAVAALQPCERFWIRMRKGFGSVAATWLHTAEQAEKWLDLWHELRGFEAEDFVVAPFLPGRDFCVAVLFQDGEFSVGKIYERLAYAHGVISISGMGSTPSLSRTVDEQAPVDTCVNAVRAVCGEYGVAPHGFYQLDMKCDEQGVSYVTEINIGRFPMTSPQFDRVGEHSLLELYIRMIMDPKAELPRGVYDFEPGILMARAMDLPYRFIREERVEAIRKRSV